MTLAEATAKLARQREQKRRWQAAARARQKALDSKHPWRAEEYAKTKYLRATRP